MDVNLSVLFQKIQACKSNIGIKRRCAPFKKVINQMHVKREMPGLEEYMNIFDSNSKATDQLNEV